MLFNSYIFLFGFLPISLIAFYGLSFNRGLAKLSLTLFSLGFYTYWRPIHLPLLLFSILFNYYVGAWIQEARERGDKRAVTAWLSIGIGVDILMLGWFKYANFLTDNLAWATGANIYLDKIALPLAISFYTFQKVAYLIDSARGDAKRMGLLDFFLFATFFPQLIAGPIVHYKEIVPQIQTSLFGRLIGRNLLVGLTIMSIGLFKKTVIADTLAQYVDPLFAAADMNATFDPLTGWLAATTYTLQLYFDFSGYSDMAIGTARMFGVKLPLNFHSPLRARSVADYWRHWHMTLQKFIYAYIYQPMSLALNRWSATRGLTGWTAFTVGIAVPTFTTFLIVGVWHGAGWTFVMLGVMHGVYVTVQEIATERNKQRRKKLRKLGLPAPTERWWNRVIAHVLTLAAVMFANVVFRASSVESASHIWAGMIGVGEGSARADLTWGLAALIAVSVLVIALFPNTQQIMRRFDPACNWAEWRDSFPSLLQWTWKPTTLGLAFVSLTLFLGLMFVQRGQALFLYFNF
jgi:D-alanyl-lipoteichoic acid acyltransferase DltB (MBOAT superfamily)